MNYIKKHYEKVILGVVLVGLVAAVVLLLFQIDRERTAMEEMRNKILALPAKPLPPLDLSRYDAILAASRTPLALNFSAPPHNLINPMPWQKAADGSLVKVSADKVGGPEKVEVTKVSPLYTIISYESYSASGTNYLIKIERQAETRSFLRRKSNYVAVGEKTETYKLSTVKGPADNPTELQLDLVGTGERVSIAPGKPYQSVEGYTVDLKYDLERHPPWTNCREGFKIRLAGDEFTIDKINLIATNQYELVLSAKSTGKKTTIKYNGTF